MQVSVDGLRWFTTQAAHDADSPVWAPAQEDPAEAFHVPDASHQLLVPLKELDLDLQVRRGTCACERARMHAHVR
jgi:hypothetical protein